MSQSIASVNVTVFNNRSQGESVMRGPVWIGAAAWAAMLWVSSLASAGTLTPWVDLPVSNSQIVQDFGGATQADNGGNGTMTHIITSGGTSTYEYNASAGPEGYLNFTSGSNGDWNATDYQHFRVRMYRTKSNGADGVQIFANPISGSNHADITLASTTLLAERPFDLSGLTLDGTGFRIDPWNYTNDASVDPFEIDYVIADRGRTLGSEFDHDGDFGGMDGRTWTPNAQAGASGVSGGLISGTTTGGDSQFNSNGASIAPSIYQWLEVRMSISDAGAGTFQSQLFFANTLGGYSEPNSVKFNILDDGAFHTYLLKLSDETNWATGGTVTNVRFDLINNPGQNVDWSIDYIRFYETALIPAPAALPAGLGLMGALLMRRRK
jgi:hypothetical protein